LVRRLRGLGRGIVDLACHHTKPVDRVRSHHIACDGGPPTNLGEKSFPPTRRPGQNAMDGEVGENRPGGILSVVCTDVEVPSGDRNGGDRSAESHSRALHLLVQWEVEVLVLRFGPQIAGLYMRRNM
jgi:hypothetical protein